jgi:two-component system sensor histidine kinase FlrB
MELGKMVATLAHQIKTPLSSAIIYAQHLTNQELPKNKLKKFSLKVNERLLYLQHLLESMLIFVKGDFPIAKPVCIFKFLDDLKTMIASLKLQYCFECIILNEVENAKINIDDNSIICAFSNLIINSIESSNAEASILIHVYKENNIIKFCISDKGLGIEEKLQAKIFEPFFTTKVTGTGLGLAVVKQIITNYAGKISCQSSNKNGTKMLVEFEEIVNA